MTQVAKLPHSDGEVLSVELTKQFPEVPLAIIRDIMEKNSNNRELCFEALSRECHRYQHHLFGVPSSEEKSQGGWQDCDKGIDVILPQLNSQAIAGRSSSSSQGSDQLEASFSKLTVDTSWLPEERPNMYHPPHSTYTPPLGAAAVVSLPVVDFVTRQQSVVSPASCPPPSIIFSLPFCQPCGVGDQKLYPADSFQVMSGTSIPGESFVGAFADKPQNIDSGYRLFHSPSFMISPSSQGRARSPLPTHGPVQLAYPAEPFQNSTIPFPFSRSPSGSTSGAAFGPPFYNQPDVFIGPQLTSGYLSPLSQDILTANVSVFGLSMNSACQPDAQLNCPASSRSSRSGSMAGEDLAYIQALLVYQKARLDAFLVDLNQQKETLEVLRSEIGQLQQQLLDRRLFRNDTFPTAVDRQKLLTENQNLQMEIRLLTYEIDLANNGQTRLGWLDSEVDQRFHDVIPSGQFNTFWPVTASQLLPESYSSPSVVSPPVQPSNIDDRVPRPLRPTRPPPPRPPFAATKAVDPDDGESWNCSACTFLNHPLLNKCECCEMPKIPTRPSALR